MFRWATGPELDGAYSRAERKSRAAVSSRGRRRGGRDGTLLMWADERFRLGPADTRTAREVQDTGLLPAHRSRRVAAATLEEMIAGDGASTRSRRRGPGDRHDRSLDGGEESGTGYF